jgi:hypothetical protein
MTGSQQPLEPILVALNFASENSEHGSLKTRMATDASVSMMVATTGAEAGLPGTTVMVMMTVRAT